MNDPILTFNSTGEAIEQRLRSTLQLFHRRQVTPTMLREVQAEAEQIIKNMIGDRTHLPMDVPLVTLIWSQMSGSAMVMFHPFVLALITEPVG
jgi:hypothetical protein